MKTIINLATALGIIASPIASFAQTVPPGVHSIAGKTQEMCGATAANAEGFYDIVSKSGATKINTSPRFIQYVFSTGGQDPDSQTWSFTRQGDPAHFTAICTKRYHDENGIARVMTMMRCDATRAICDQLYVQLFAPRTSQPRR